MMHFSLIRSNNIFNLILKGALVILFNLLFFSQNLNAQKFSNILIMSSIGELDNVSSNSMPIIFNSNVNCLNVQNGAFLLLEDKGNDFISMDCEVNKKFNTLGIKLYPNPVIGTTNLKLVNPPPYNDIFNISIWGVDGFKITSGKAKGYELFQGMHLDFSMLHMGTYIIQLESEKFNDAIKFIKSSYK